MFDFVLKPLPPTPEGFTAVPEFRCVVKGCTGDYDATSAYRLASAIQALIDQWDIYAVIERQTDAGSIQVSSTWDPLKLQWQPWSPL